MISLGIQNSTGSSITNPLPLDWLNKAGMPVSPPSWAEIATLSSLQIQRLQAQIAYDQSGWNYSKIGKNNLIGAYQFAPATLETYGLLAAGSNSAYGIDCINYRICWNQVLVRNSTNSYANYLYNVQNLKGFFTNTVAQDHLAFQYIYDLYNQLTQINAITPTDSADIIAGMIYVAWNLGVGQAGSVVNANGTGAYAWRYFGIGNGSNSYNTGRYAITVLSQ